MSTLRTIDSKPYFKNIKLIFPKTLCENKKSYYFNFEANQFLNSASTYSVLFQDLNY